MTQGIRDTDLLRYLSGLTGDDSDDEQSPLFEAKDIPSLAKYIKSSECKNVFLMVGMPARYEANNESDNVVLCLTLARRR